MARTTVRSGSRGEDVRLLQSLLNQNGYDLAVDGIYGEKTEAAVRDYQRRNSLSVDGVAGTQTWGKLTTGSNPGTGNSTAGSTWTDNWATGTGAPGSTGWTGGSWTGNGGGSAMGSTVGSAIGSTFAAPAYTPSGQARQAWEDYQRALGSPPAPYQSAYQDRIEQLLGQIENRPEFQYDFAADPVYQMYVGRFTQQGQRAMDDTLGRAAALTGGYASSYAQSAGQQAYQQALQALNDLVPDLQDAAYRRYQDENSALRAQLSLLQALDDAQYDRYRDAAGDWQSGVNSAYQRYQDAARQEQNNYDQYLDALDRWQQAQTAATGGSATATETRTATGSAGTSGGSGSTAGSTASKSATKSGKPANSGTLTGSGSTASAASDSLDRFQRSLMPETQFNSLTRAGDLTGYRSYLDYVANMLSGWLTRGLLTPAQGDAVRKKYGF